MDAPIRSLVLWFPDWPVTALTRAAASEPRRPDPSRPGRAGAPAVTGRAPVMTGRAPAMTGRAPAARAIVPDAEPLDPALPIAVIEGNAVIACSAAARAEGVRRGQRRRDAQSRCPGLRIVPADAARDHRAFAPVIARIEEKAPGVQLVRPGLCALRARGPARYYGGETEAARMLVAELRAFGLDDVRAGIADGPFTAEQAAKAGAVPGDPVFVVPAGGAAGFLASLPVSVLDAAALGPSTKGEDRRRSASDDLVGLLARLGVQTLGDFAAMPPDRVRERFGGRGIRLHALAGGRDSQPVHPRTPPPELQREVAFEPPLEIADQVAFGMRVAADDFIAGLGAIDLVCTELRVELVGDRGERSERVWLHPASFDAAAVVDRVRWQLGEDTESLRSGVALVRITPEAVDAASHHRPAIFGSAPEEKVHHALSRVQAMLGHRAVVTPAIGGGRWLTERQVLVPWGDRAVVAKERARPWPGSLPDPLPTTVFAEPPTVEVLTLGGYAVEVDDRGAVTAVPAVLVEGGRVRRIEEWAGPWPVVERGWDAARARRAHRFQVVDDEGAAWLLVCERGSWTIEGSYD
ncbi:DNA polymerase Y family protein [Microbacterium sp.]|uniref:DNA polymerase Y family protein n=1 Tax=Microbacterium sp. TaxID=51671 RepID=UPI003F6F7E19